MSRTITIDPITRLEGHGKIQIFLDDAGDVDRAFLQLPELRGFEAFAVGRPAEDMPQITSRICGICPMAHHMASTRALDDLFGVEPPPAAQAVRELAYCLFLVEDHALHFYFLGGPDLLVPPGAGPARRNVLGVLAALGDAAGRRVIAVRRRVRALMESIAGKAIHPVFGLPGGVSKPVSEAQRAAAREVGREAVDFAVATLELFAERVLCDPRWREVVDHDISRLETYSMGLVDDRRRASFVGGDLRVVRPDGLEHALFPARDYAAHVGEHVEPWTYVKFPFLREPGWAGFADGPASGLYRVGPLARLNAAAALGTPLAEAERLRLFEAFGGRPVHHAVANHWARLVEVLHAAERVVELAEAPELTSPDVRNLDLCVPAEGIGVVEAPRGTLIHHYRTDCRGVLTACNMVVATVGNAAALTMAVERAARHFIHAGVVDEELLAKVEAAFRAYDPCMSCATHALTGGPSLRIEVVDSARDVVATLARA